MTQNQSGLYIREDYCFHSQRRLFFWCTFCPNLNLDLKNTSNIRKKVTAIRNCPELLLIVRYFVYSQNMRTSCRRLHICLVKFNQRALFSFYIVSFYSCCSFRTQTRWSRLIKSADSSSTTWPLTPSGLVKEWPGERPRPGEKSSLSSMPSKHEKVLIWSTISFHPSQ